MALRAAARIFWLSATLEPPNFCTMIDIAKRTNGFLAGTGAGTRVTRGQTTDYDPTGWKGQRGASVKSCRSRILALTIIIAVSQRRGHSDGWTRHRVIK